MTGWPITWRRGHPRPPGRDAARQTRRVRVLAALLAVQALCAVFFVGDVIADLRNEGMTLHLAFEAAVAAALAVGLGFGTVEMRRTLERIDAAETAFASASGAFADVVAASFRDWGLTPAEADVALLTLKGLEPGEIAAARGAANGTVRAQLARAYAKAGVSNRGAFVSLFVEALVEGMPLPPPR